MKYLLTLLAVCGFFACSQAPKNAENNPKNQNYLTFKYSNEIATMDLRDPNNWCNAHFGESALISADPKNFNRRLFALSDIPSKLLIDYGHQTAAMLLYKQGNYVEIYTSDNLPACLSNKVNFQISPDGISFRYDNKMGIQFDAYLQELPNGIQIALDLPPNGAHGMSVLRCEACK